MSGIRNKEIKNGADVSKKYAFDRALLMMDASGWGGGGGHTFIFDLRARPWHKPSLAYKAKCGILLLITPEMYTCTSSSLKRARSDIFFGPYRVISRSIYYE